MDIQGHGINTFQVVVAKVSIFFCKGKSKGLLEHDIDKSYTENTSRQGLSNKAKWSPWTEACTGMANGKVHESASNK
jgi:hypothetical protein